MFVRECMFGGTWGAFSRAGRHFFNPDHPTYQGIARNAAARRQQPALRYGRQYFREISGNGHDFGHPLDGLCTLAFSRILDTSEILVTLNLDRNPRNDWVTTDASLNRDGAAMRNLLQPDEKLLVENRQGRLAVRVPLFGHTIALWACEP